MQTIRDILEFHGFRLQESVPLPSGNGVHVHYQRAVQFPTPAGTPICCVFYVTRDPAGHTVEQLEIALVGPLPDGESLTLQVQGLAYDNTFAQRLRKLEVRLVDAWAAAARD